MRGCLLALSLSSCAHYAHGIPNFAQVEPGIYRGGEPTRQGWKYLRSLGVDSVVQLDYDWERSANAPTGISVYQISMPPADADDLFRGPSVSDLTLAANLIGVRTGSIFVHCLHGQDRTGVVIAAYRHVVEGWTKQRAIEEAKRLGLHSLLFGLMRSWEALP